MAAKTPPPKTGGKKVPAGKKIPKWAYIAGAVGVVGVVYYVKKHKESTEGNATPTADQGLTSQAFIPVTGENVAGAGAGGGGSVGGSEGTSALLGLVSEENKQNQEYQREQSTALREYLKSNQEENHSSQLGFLEALKGLTGGGAPSSGQAGSGAGTASPPSGGSAPAPPVTPPEVVKVTPQPPSGSGGEKPRVIRCGNGCEGHQYKTHTDCQTKVKGHCVWPS